tara:strand:+ start:320 stop:814 length:495 start_codon:yes stop_codon:yes gene_type:complete
MKKDKKIKELDTWLENAKDDDFLSNKTSNTNELSLDKFNYNFEQILSIDNNYGVFEFKRNGVQDYVLNRLKKKNEENITTSLDLHGETVKDAIDILDKFFLNSYKSNIEYIKIICGKGMNSKDKVPKIKITTQAYIKKSPIVNAACSAKDREGGVGVIKIKLKN